MGTRGAGLSLALALIAGSAVAAGGPALAQGSAPGAPGANATWNESNVTGFADSLGSSSKVWYTLGNGELENVFYPQTDTPDTFGLQYIVTDGSSFTATETANTSHAISLADPTSLAWQQVNTATNGDFTITKTYIADPSRSVVLIQTTFDNRTSTPLQLYADYQPQLNNDGMGNTGGTDSASGDLVASNGSVSSALARVGRLHPDHQRLRRQLQRRQHPAGQQSRADQHLLLRADRRAPGAGGADPGGSDRVDHIHPGPRLRLQPVRGRLRRRRVAGRRVHLAGELVRVRLALLDRRPERPARVRDRQRPADGAVLREEPNGTIRADGKCLDVIGGATGNGSLVDLYDCNGTGAQVWQPQPDGALLNPQSGKCLDDTGFSTTPGTQVQIWSCTGAANQSWVQP